MSKVLLVDDEPGVLFTLKELLLDRGHEPVATTSAREALKKLDGVEAAIVDLSMPEMHGLDLLRAIHEREESLPVLILTAHGSERDAVAAMKAGAYDYLTKPFDVDEVALAVERAVEARELRTAKRRLEAEQAIGRRIVGDSPSMRRLLDAIGRVASKDVTVLVRGETGTGKELVASLIHAESRRAKGPLVRFNCAAIPGELAEAELFGHARGAFTGAVQQRRGFFALAHGGTLVLDEVGELSQGVQAKLLRAIQEGEIQPVGSGRIEKVDVRIVACTNRDLEAEARAGRFREDLYYRLAVVELVAPALRDRREDVPLLAREFARHYADKFGVADVQLTEPLMRELARADWPGNVRQLENLVARMIALSSGGVLDVDALEGRGVEQAARGAEGALDSGLSLKEQVEAFERGLIARALDQSQGNQSEAARILGMSRPTLIDKIKKYGLGNAPPV
jgi:two-component system response regulator AtoC